MLEWETHTSGHVPYGIVRRDSVSCCDRDSPCCWRNHRFLLKKAVVMRIIIAIVAVIAAYFGFISLGGVEQGSKNLVACMDQSPHPTLRYTSGSYRSVSVL